MSEPDNNKEEGWEDDEMEDLFSFGTGAPDDGESTPPIMVESPPVEADEAANRDRSGTEDSFMEMLDEETAATASALDVVSTGVGSGGTEVKDKETQDILNWLDNDDDGEAKEEAAAAPSTDAAVADTATTTADSAAAAPVTAIDGSTVKQEDTAVAPAKVMKDDSIKEEAPSSVPAPVAPPAAPTIVVIPPPPKPTFDTLDAALQSKESTVAQIRSLFASSNMKLSDSDLRPELWSRIVCNKSIDDLAASSNADSYTKWKETADLSTFTNERSLWIKKEAPILAERIACMDRDEATTELTALLLFYYMGNAQKDMDPLVPPVACTILSAGIAPAAASVVLSNIMPSFMPLLALTQEERLSAARALHTQFYLLACYHLPLLVFHLDRYAPGWHWPKVLKASSSSTSDDEGADDSKTENDNSHAAWRHLETHGVVPQSWLISHLAGECHGTLMNPMWLLSLWDLILTSSNNSLRFFLALAVLEKHSDTLLMITGEKLVLELNRIMEFKEGTTLEGFAIEGEEETTYTEAVDWVQEWCGRARMLWESTPRSVVSRLRKAEDEAVSYALRERQRKAEEELHAKLEAEAKAHKDATDAEREKRAEEGRDRLNRARLVLYYKKFNPEREGNIDKIMETFDGRLEVLDAKLRTKYGQGFNPALKPKTTGKLLSLGSTMNIGLSHQRKRISNALHKKNENDLSNNKQIHEVTVQVSPNEVLPIICWAKEADSYKKASSRPCDALKYYLVDSRPEETAREQGGFPTALTMSPEALLDPDRIKEQEDIFESLRGAAHIVVMGEGFSAVTSLYGQKVNPSLSQLIEEDDSRTNLCALFFVKKGFPFVSILEGGFCGAHAWLSREGPKRHLNVDLVLVDYMGEASMFGELEKAYREQREFANASTAEKTTMALQGLFDKSMTSLTINKSRLEKIAAKTDTPSQANASSEGRFSKFLKQADDLKSSYASGGANRFRSRFGDAKVADASKAVTAPSPVPSPTKTTMAATSVVAAAPITAATSGQIDASESVPFEPVVLETSNVTLQQQAQQDAAGAKKNRFVAMGAAKLSALNSSIAKIAADKPSLSDAAAAQPPSTAPQENRFASFGAALNKAVKNTTATAAQQPLPDVLKRNPFARFGAKGQQPQQPKVNRFGMNQLSNRLAGLRAAGGVEEEQEESVIKFSDMN